jgi:hypothetical protein
VQSEFTAPKGFITEREDEQLRPNYVSRWGDDKNPEKEVVLEA